MKTSFSISIAIEHSLEVDEVWPDGDAPDNPTAEDVKRALFRNKVNPSASEVKRALEDWDLLDVDSSCVTVLAMTPPCDKCRRQFGHRPGCENERPRMRPVTDADLDAPDGAVVDGYRRSGDQWVRLDDVQPSLAPASLQNTADALNATFAHVPLACRPVFCQKCGANGIDDKGECRECGHVQEAPQ